ncbi:hypothetical protein GDO81_005275 [Engystomops pustulosus]|uniref:Uncharacterized protein n=1 Tax=Engystomops pustulosus TaxID=76066 RepID=A0AAV7CP21_ENGPU|nr:hypothetical protein GDO81_005275 [Engystomops pustulosus]
MQQSSLFLRSMDMIPLENTKSLPLLPVDPLCDGLSSSPMITELHGSGGLSIQMTLCHFHRKHLFKDQTTSRRLEMSLPNLEDYSKYPY